MKPGRNDPCPCGSGKKYKHCCSNLSQASTSAQPASQAPTTNEQNHLLPCTRLDAMPNWKDKPVFSSGAIRTPDLAGKF
ncbi:MAG: SEC-C metal-binding domain-containing protein [Gallionella sp.]|nr:SEC-C metal-binding domain-containing protein [Gallionella sp.]